MISYTYFLYANILKVIPRVHLMEGIVTVPKVPSLAENFLEALRSGDNPTVANTVDAIRNATKAEKLKQAEQHRYIVLKAMGLSQADDGRFVLVTPFIPKANFKNKKKNYCTCST